MRPCRKLFDRGVDHRFVAVAQRQYRGARDSIERDRQSQRNRDAFRHTSR